MADINHVISLGIGSPADVPHFTLFGLSPFAAGVVAAVEAYGARRVRVPNPHRVVSVPNPRRIVRVPRRPR